MSGADEALRDIAQELARIRSENARLIARLDEGERRFRLISRGVLRVQEAERARISRELHDGVGQALTALKMQLELLQQPGTQAGSELATRLAELSSLAERALEDVRQISRLVRPQMLDELGLLPTLRWLARSFGRQGLAVELDHEGVDDRLDPEVETLVFRVAQEALTNAVKHARAASARVELRRQGNFLSLRIEDSGAGFDAAAVLASPDQDRSFGLRGMRDRVHLLGGRFALRSSPGSGTVVEAEVEVGAGE
jgi:two-component system sensor histidine kinase UhpB